MAHFFFEVDVDRKTYLDALEGSLINLLKNAIIKALIIRLPFLAWGPLEPILGYIVGKLLDAGAKEAKIRIFFLYTDLRVNHQSKEYEQAAIEFNINRSPENEQKMLDAFYKLGSLAG